MLVCCSAPALAASTTLPSGFSQCTKYNAVNACPQAAAIASGRLATARAHSFFKARRHQGLLVLVMTLVDGVDVLVLAVDGALAHAYVLGRTPLAGMPTLTCPA